MPSELDNVSVTIRGRWDESPKRIWRGTAVSPEPLVAAVFLQHGNILEWAKSDRGGEEGLRVALSLFPRDAANLDVCAVLSVGPMGGGQRQLDCRVSSATYRPILKDEQGAPAGRLIEFARVEGEPTLVFSLLFLARRHVEVRRKGIWRPKPQVAALLPPELAQVLFRCRTGEQAKAH